MSEEEPDDLDLLVKDEDHYYPERPPLEGKSNLLLLFPTLCDIVGTTLMNAGILFVAASVYQMLLGAVVVLTALLSTVILKARYQPYKIFGLVAVLGGICIIGASPILYPESFEDESSSNAAVGVFLVLLGQFFAACQFVSEEKIMLEYETVPLKIVGLEGVFGCIITVIFMVVGHFSGISSLSKMLDIGAGYYQIFGDSVLWLTSIGMALSIGGFNSFGLHVTRHISSTSRSTIDACRTLFVWIISLSLSWERFIPLQVVGFIVLVFGTFLFNDVFNEILSKCFV